MAMEMPSTDALIGLALFVISGAGGAVWWTWGLHGTAKGAEKAVGALQLYVEKELARIERQRHEDLTAQIQSRIEVMEALDSLRVGQTRILERLAQIKHEDKG